MGHATFTGGPIANHGPPARSRLGSSRATPSQELAWAPFDGHRVVGSPGQMQQWRRHRFYFLFFIFLPIYCLLGPCPMSDIAYIVSTVASSFASFVNLYICFNRLGLKCVSS